MKTDTNLNLASEIKSALRIEEEFRADGCDLIASGRDFECCCPFHSENTASCKIHPEQNYFKCFGCGASGDILDYISYVKFERKCKEITSAQFVEVIREGALRAGLEFQEERPNEPAKSHTVYSLEKLYKYCEYQATTNGEKVSQKNEYVNPETQKIEVISIRFEKDGKKRILLATPNGDGFSFGLQGDGRKQPIFNRTRIKDSSIVVVCEGESKVYCLHKIDIVATCNIAGSKHAKKADWTPLIGKQIIIWRDNDDAGLQWQKDVLEELETLGITADCVEIEKTAVEKGDDVCDFYERLTGTNEEKYEALIAVLRGAMAETVQSQLESDIAGTRYAIRHEAFYALASTLMFLPGSLTMLCASPGVSKSFLVLQWIWQMFLDGVKCCVLELESGNVFHERRIIAQMAGNNGFLDNLWCKSNPDLARNIYNTHSPSLKILQENKVIQFSGFSKVDTVYLLSWIEKMATAGFILIAIDPITMLETGENFWKEQQDFVRAVKRLVWKYQIRLLLVTHPSKNAKDEIHLNNMAGAIAFSQNSDTALWMEIHPTLEKVEMNGSGFDRKKYNRTMHILKARLGPAKTRLVGFYMDGARLIHEEVGFLEQA